MSTSFSAAVLGARFVLVCLLPSCMAFSAAVLGASGNVGRSLVRHLVTAPDVDRVVLLGRRHYDGMPESVIQHVVPMDATLAEAAAPLLAGVDVAFNCMGVGKPSKSTVEELELVDVTIPTAFFTAAKAAGVRHASILTSVGSDINSKYSWITRTSAGGGYYMHIKGQVEHNVQELAFASTDIVRPGAILGNSNTPGIVGPLMKAVSFMIPSKYHSIHKDDLAMAMLVGARHALAAGAADTPQVHAYEGKPLFALAAEGNAAALSEPAAGAGGSAGEL